MQTLITTPVTAESVGILDDYISSLGIPEGGFKVPGSFLRWLSEQPRYPIPSAPKVLI